MSNVKLKIYAYKFDPPNRGNFRIDKITVVALNKRDAIKAAKKRHKAPVFVSRSIWQVTL